MIISRLVNGVRVFRCGTEVEGRVLYWTHFYQHRDIVFDCGCPNIAGEVANALKNVKAVLVTHYHEDHVGAAPALKARGARVLASEKTIPLLKTPPQIPQYRRVVWGQPELVEAEPLDKFMSLGGVDVEVIETPGHTFDHISFLADGFLFSGDLAISDRQVVWMREEEVNETIKSLENTLKKDFEVAFGGPGPMSRREVEAYLSYLKSLKEHVEEMHGEGLSVEEIVERIFPNPPQVALIMEFVSGKEWARENMVKSILGIPRTT
ncbi:MAG: MBL fold metallo-hydrolase [Candidatus Freyarchaeota archaeon]|nr:MBL fold metallo-hydrolase [Candidatus Jordarchaeia archaeon]